MNVVDLVRIELPCPSCGQRYPLSLSQVLIAQEMAHDGCSARGEDECPQDFLAPMLDHDAILTLREAWAMLEDQATAIGGALVLGSETAPLRPGSAAERSRQ